MAEKLAVRMQGITKRFPGVLAIDKVDLDLHLGEVHGLLGENGAGKSTLMNVLFGLYTPEDGQIFVDGEEAGIRSPAGAISLGIGMVHQHFRLVRPFTVTENIILGLQDGSTILDLKQAEKRVAEIAAQYAMKVDPRARIQDLSVGEQQRVEILNSLYRGANVLILDEPTAVLTPQEANELVFTLRDMAAQGKSIVFISHKLEEVMKVTDRVTVLRQGKKVFESSTADTSINRLAQEMIGHQIKELERVDSSYILTLAGAGEVAGPLTHEHLEIEQTKAEIEVKNLQVDDDRGLPAVRDLSLAIYPGEILAIAGVDGNGQRELAEAITGQRAITSGQVIVAGEDATQWKARDFIAKNVAVITEDRQSEGLVLNFNLSRNAVLKYFKRAPFSRRGLLNFSTINSFTAGLIDSFNVSTPGTYVDAGTLSGGNQQKLVLARELSQEPPLIIANKPTRGLDIGATAYIHQKLSDERARGAAILLISADLDEISALSDRVMVMFDGRNMGTMNIADANLEKIGLMMAGTPLSEIPSS
jgi:general nucleoside transport system ATP-binding protein